MDYRKRLLLNEQEQVTDKALREVADTHGLRICPKVALSEALDIDRAGISGPLKSYALLIEARTAQMGAVLAITLDRKDVAVGIFEPSDFTAARAR